MDQNTELKVGDWVEVRSKQEILSTLDLNARVDELPFMPQMFAYCGKRFRVSKSAHKACDTVNSTGARQINDVVHLENLRCDGSSYDGCQSECLLYFKKAWLKPVDASDVGSNQPSARDVSIGEMGDAACTEATVIASTRADSSDSAKSRYVCQATQLPYASRHLSMWDVRQYVMDYSSGNTRFGEMVEPIVFVAFNAVVNAGIGLGTPLRWVYDKIQHARGQTPYPWRPAPIPKGGKTPSGNLNLQRGDWVRVKSYPEILKTLDEDYNNRGMAFNAELAYYCGRTYRVVRRIEKIMDEKNGRLLQLKNDCIVLEGTDCVGRFTRPLFCPRGGYTYWREVWLERVAPMGDDRHASLERGVQSQACSH
jgi:hypothetical protein